MLERLVRELGLDEQQQAQLEETAATFRQRMREAAPSPENMRELWDELRQARESGDQARIDELRQQMRELRSASQQVMNEFFDQVQSTILRPEQVERFSEMRARMAGPPIDRERGPRLRQMIQTLPDELGLDQEQRAKFEELAAELRPSGEARGQRWQEVRPLMEELWEAEAAGDQAKAEEIRQKLRAARTEAGNPLESFFTQVEQILRDDQKAKLAEIRASFGPAAEPRQPEGQGLDVRSVIRAARRLDLDGTQREAVQKIIQDAMRSLRDQGRANREAQTELANQVKEQILAVLTAEQKAQFERVLQGERPRRGPGERPEGRPRGAGEGPHGRPPEP